MSSTVGRVATLAVVVLALIPLNAAAHRGHPDLREAFQVEGVPRTRNHDRSHVVESGSRHCPTAPGKTCGCTGLPCGGTGKAAAARNGTLATLVSWQAGESVRPPVCTCPASRIFVPSAAPRAPPLSS